MRSVPKSSLTSPDDLFRGIKKAASPARPKKQVRPPDEVQPITAQNGKMVTVGLTMPRELFERYKSRGRFRDEMVRQLSKKFE